MEFDLNSLSLSELKELQGKVARTIAGFEERKKREALAAVENQAREMGFSLGELLELQAEKGGRKRTASVAKYANPANAAETWSGRGRKPGWFIAALAGGKSAADLEL